MSGERLRIPHLTDLHLRRSLPGTADRSERLSRDMPLAAADVSDGLVADLGHIADASGVAIAVRADAVPLSPAAWSALKGDAGLLQTILSGGDDYELAFCAPHDAADTVQAVAKESGIPVTAIGTVADMVPLRGLR